jgi:NitT/TauT family transport system substrate-binding protein
MTYNEYWQVIDAGFKPGDLVVFKYTDQGVATLEDGLYANGGKLSDAAYKDKLARFVAASNKGWDYAIKHQDEGAKIVLDNDTTGAQTEKHQKRMMGEIAKLVEGSKKGTGYLDPADAERTVGILLSTQSDPVITKKPEGAWTNEIFELSKKYVK